MSDFKFSGPGGILDKLGINKEEAVINDTKLEGPTFYNMKTSASSPVSGAIGFSDADYFFTYNPINLANYAEDFGYAFAIEENGSYVKINGQNAVYRFPINPSNISIDTPVATSTEVTMKGIFETHNGAPLRRISISGTTGVFPTFKSLDTSKESQSSVSKNLDYAFKNTLKSVSAVVDSVNKSITAFESGGNQGTSGPLNRNFNGINLTNPEPTPNNPGAAISKFFNQNEKSSNNNKTDYEVTGFAKIHDLKRFLDFYISAKKEVENSKWRLVFYMKKDDEKYYCTLNSYSIQKAAGTIEYNYSIQLTSWRRTPIIGGVVKKKKAIPTKATSTVLSNITNGLKKSREVIAKSIDVLYGIRSDVYGSLIAPLGELYLLGADIVGAKKSLDDFLQSPDTVKGLKQAILDYVIKNPEIIANLDEKYVPPFIQLNPAENYDLIVGIRGRRKRLPSGDFFTLQDQEADERPDYYFNFYSKIPLDDLNLTDDMNKDIQSLIDKSRSLTSGDIITRRNTMANFIKSVSDALGGGSSTYNRISNQGAVKKTYKKLNTSDIALLSNFNEILMQTDALISAMDKAETEVTEDYYTFYKDYATNSGLVFSDQNVSKFYVPFQHGASLEMLALTYLGDPDRWIEIASLNSLKAPYIDEVGTSIKILASSGGNTLLVGSDKNLYIGQVVEISSSTQIKTIRKIRSVDVINSAQTLITFEESTGLNLTAYKPSENAVIKVYAPNTVNSDMLIAIPSTTTPIQDSVFKITPELSDLDKLARIAKIDLLLDTQGDLILSGGGDIKLAVGLANITQAAMMKLKTKTNQLLQAPEYGNPV